MSEETKKPWFNKYTIYKANKTNNGSAHELQLSKTKDGFALFWSIAKQKGELDTNGNARFDWENKINLSLGPNDLAIILGFSTGRSPDPVKLFHDYQGRVTTVEFTPGTKMAAMINIRVKDAEKGDVQIGTTLSHGELAIFQQLLLNALPYLYW